MQSLLQKGTLWCGKIGILYILHSAAIFIYFFALNNKNVHLVF